MPYMSQLTGKTEQDMFGDLKGVIFLNPMHTSEEDGRPKYLPAVELPADYFVLTLGLSAPLESDRVAAKTEPYPGRWTTHFVISSPSDSDEELFDWIEQAYQFAQAK